MDSALEADLRKRRFRMVVGTITAVVVVLAIIIAVVMAKKSDKEGMDNPNDPLYCDGIPKKYCGSNICHWDDNGLGNGGGLCVYRAKHTG